MRTHASVSPAVLPGLVVGLSLCLHACGSETNAPPRLLRVEPEVVSDAEATVMNVLGENFYKGFAVRLDHDEPYRIEDSWQLWVGVTPLEDVRRRDVNTLVAKVPSRAPVGLHDLKALSPDGTRLELRSAVTVVKAPSLASNGASCRADDDCISSQCVNGTCCEQRCDGACNACALVQTGVSDGICAPVMGAPEPVEQTEVSCDGRDNDCDDVIDEGCPCDYLGLEEGVCLGGGRRADDGSCSIAPTAYEATESTCSDGLDNDCSGFADSDCCGPGSPDADNDGVGDACDTCPEGDDTQDTDGDGVPDACDLCPGPEPDPALWWDLDYRHRAAVEIQGGAGTVPSGYSVMVPLDTATLIAAGQMQADVRDVRVVWKDGSNHVELDRHVIGPNGNTTQVWFKTQGEITGTDTSYAVYFDNPAADAPPAHWSDRMGADAPSGVYLAADNFEGQTVGVSPLGWEGSPRYRPTNVSGNRVLEVQSQNNIGDYLFAGSTLWGDIAVSARLRILNTGGEFYGLYVRAGSGSPFLAGYFGTEVTTSSLGVWNTRINSPDATGILESANGPTSNVGALGTGWHTLAVAMVGTTLTFYYDGAPLLDPAAALFQQAFPTEQRQGRIGLCVGYPAARAYWDDIVVRKYRYPEPAASANAPIDRCQ